ncbi:MAG: hypothetical protein KKD05_01445 [Candidatus Omnitrophica bacterium]|nr:hypothetical protein [Candidatus Omnitrophota bacterium]
MKKKTGRYLTCLFVMCLLSSVACFAGEDKLAPNVIIGNAELMDSFNALCLENSLMVEAYSHYIRDEYSMANKSCGKVIERNPGNREALWLLGRINMNQNRYDGAVEYFKRAYLAGKREVLFELEMLAAYTNIINELIDKNDDLRTIGIYKELVSLNIDYDKTVDMGLAIIVKWPENPMASYLLGVVFKEKEFLSMTITYFRTAYLAGLRERWFIEEMLNVFRDRIKTQISVGNILDAQLIIMDLLVKADRDVFLNAYLNSFLFNELIPLLSSNLETNTNPFVYFQMGNIYAITGDIDLALKNYGLAAAFGPRNHIFGYFGLLSEYIFLAQEILDSYPGSPGKMPRSEYEKTWIDYSAQLEKYEILFEMIKGFGLNAEDNIYAEGLKRISFGEFVQERLLKIVLFREQSLREFFLSEVNVVGEEIFGAPMFTPEEISGQGNYQKEFGFEIQIEQAV